MPRRPGGGKQKGSAYERHICREMSRWLSKGESEDWLWRSAMSGGRATVAYAKGQHLLTQVGDISSIHPGSAPFIAKFYVECKHYTNLEYWGLVTQTGNLVRFWKDTVAGATQYGKIPMMISKQNHLTSVICTDESGLGYFGLQPSDCDIYSGVIDLCLLRFERFLKMAHVPDNL